jgi:hypothetical protein
VIQRFGTYVNVVKDEGQENVESSSHDNDTRLARIKFDSTNLFGEPGDATNFAPGQDRCADVPCAKAAARE